MSDVRKSLGWLSFLAYAEMNTFSLLHHSSCPEVMSVSLLITVFPTLFSPLMLTRIFIPITSFIHASMLNTVKKNTTGATWSHANVSTLRWGKREFHLLVSGLTSNSLPHLLFSSGDRFTNPIYALTSELVFCMLYGTYDICSCSVEKSPHTFTHTHTQLNPISKSYLCSIMPW